MPSDTQQAPAGQPLTLINGGVANCPWCGCKPMEHHLASCSFRLPSESKAERDELRSQLDATQKVLDAVNLAGVGQSAREAVLEAQLSTTRETNTKLDRTVRLLQAQIAGQHEREAVEYQRGRDTTREIARELAAGLKQLRDAAKLLGLTQHPVDELIERARAAGFMDDRSAEATERKS